MHLSVVAFWFNSCGLPFPFVFSYLAMPVRQMLSGVILDCSAPVRCRSCRACRAMARSAVGDEPGLLSYVLPHVLPYLLTHVPERI